MKYITAISIPAIITAAVGTWSAAAWVADPGGRSTNGRLARPQIALSTTRCDLGSVPADAPLQARFAIRNNGGRRLIVRRDDGACCGQADHHDAIIVNPASSAELVATIDAAGQSGPLEKTITYTTNDPELPRFDLVISASIANHY